MIFEKYYPLSSRKMFKVDVVNKKAGILITVIEGNYLNARKVLKSIFWDFSPPYTTVNPDSKEDVKHLKKYLLEEIEKKKEQIEKMEMVVKMCSRKNVFIEKK